MGRGEPSMIAAADTAQIVRGVPPAQCALDRGAELGCE
jgi:hypothetical protein